MALVQLLRRRAGVEQRFSEVRFDLLSARMTLADERGEPITDDEDDAATAGEPAGN